MGTHSFNSGRDTAACFDDGWADVLILINQGKFLAFRSCCYKILVQDGGVLEQFFQW